MPLLLTLLLSALAAEPAPRELTLDDALRTLRDDAPSAARLQARIDEARATWRLALAAHLPVVAAQGSYTRNNAEVSVGIGGVFEQLQAALPFPVGIDPSTLPDDILIQPLNQLSGALSVTVPLLNPAALADLQTARAGVDATVTGAAASSARLEAGFTRAAWGAMAAEQLGQARSAAEQLAAEHLQRARRRHEAGLGTALEVLVAETEHARRASDAQQAAADADAAHRALASLLGLDGAVRVLLPSAAPQPAAGAHPDLAAAAASVRVADRGVAASWWRHAPTFAASAQLFGSDVPYPTGLRTGWRLGVQATWVLYDGGARYGLLSRSLAQRDAAEASARATALDADRAVRDATQAVDVARVRLDLAERGRATAAEAEATAARLYDAGLAAHTDALDAQQRLVDADAALVAARAALGMATADLRFATGGFGPG